MKKRKPKPAPVETVVLPPPTPPPKPVPVRGIGVQVDYNDKENNWCPDLGSCGSEHKSLKLHLFKCGWCSWDSGPVSHKKCHGVYRTNGASKVIACDCECHKPPLKKLKKMAHHE